MKEIHLGKMKNDERAAHVLDRVACQDGCAGEFMIAVSPTCQPAPQWIPNNQSFQMDSVWIGFPKTIHFKWIPVGFPKTIHFEWIPVGFPKTIHFEWIGIGLDSLEADSQFPGNYVCPLKRFRGINFCQTVKIEKIR